METSRRVSTLLVCTAFIGSLIAALPTSVSAQLSTIPGLSALDPVGPFLLRFDEGGRATITVGANGTPTLLTGTLQLDPAAVAGSGQLVLTYMLPEPVIAGDVSFAEVAGAAGNSDWLRFTDSNGSLRGATGQGSRMIFYSDIEAGDTNPSLADKVFPANLGSGNFLAQVQVGLEGNNGFDYRPGNVPAFQNNEYIGISDAIPEPETYVLMLAGLAVVGTIARRRRH